MTRIAFIINPISGTGGRPEIARRRAEEAVAFAERARLDPQVFVTERVGHARELAAAVVAQGVPLVVAWGGDGTVNEVGSALAFSGATLAIVPSGSGNGLARELGIPQRAADALDLLLTGTDLVMDAGELDRRLFFNVAGIGLDAVVAHRFAAGGLVHRGFKRYLQVGLRELFTFEPEELAIAVDGTVQRTRVLFVAVANARQYGNGAIIAPHARIDDGRLDVVVIDYRPPLMTLVQAPGVFAGRVDRIRGVTIQRGTTVEIGASRPILYHVDGEPFVGDVSIRGGIHPGALRVRVSREAARNAPTLGPKP